MSKILLNIMIDGLRWDYVNQEVMPFIYNRSHRESIYRLEETFTFQTRPAYFAGLNPDEAMVGPMYWFEPEDTPFKYFNLLPDIFPHGSFLYKAWRHILAYLSKFRERKKGRDFSSSYIHPLSIPLKIINNFSVSEKVDPQVKGVYNDNKTIFDFLRENQKNWFYLGYPYNDQREQALTNATLSKNEKNYSFGFIHYAEPDWLGHKFGPKSKEVNEKLKEIDEAVNKIYSHFANLYDEVELLVYGDHGMVKIKNQIDIEKVLSQLKSKIGKDYVYFLDSTLARFWFNSKNSQSEIENTLKEIQGIRKLTMDEIIELGVNFGERKFGDSIFLVEEGFMIFPYFFNRGKPEKGIHGFHPKVMNNDAFFSRIMNFDNSEKINYKKGNLRDIFVTNLRLLGFDPPNNIKSRNLLE